MKETIELTTTLTTICIVSAILLSLVYETINPIIQENKQKELMNSLKEVLPQVNSFEEINMSKSEGIISVFKGVKDEKIIGYTIISEASGYGGKMKVLVGVDKEKSITGIKIIEHQETPGIGTRIEGKDFLSHFIGKSGEFSVDAITGATISSNAVIEAVKESLNKVNLD